MSIGRELFYNPKPEEVERHHPNTHIGPCTEWASPLHWLFARPSDDLLSLILCVLIFSQVVFSLFVTQLQGLEKPSALSFRSSFHLLECLATTKAFNLCLSLDSQDLLADLFKMMFAIVK